jgi:hypothetical protein
MTVHQHTCPTCQANMKYIKEVPPDFVRASRSTFSGKVPSQIHECPEHGQFRIYVSGRIESYAE